MLNSNYKFSFFFLSLLFILPQCRKYTLLGIYNPNTRGTDDCREAKDCGPEPRYKYTRAGLPECVVNTMPEPPSETTQDRTQTNDTHPVPGEKLKFLTRAAVEKLRT